MIVERKLIMDDVDVIGYIECLYESSNILKTIYFPSINKLYISFGRGGTYSYLNVSEELYDKFEKSESTGKFFKEHISGNKEIPFKREFELKPFEIEDAKRIIEEHKLNDDE